MQWEFVMLEWRRLSILLLVLLLGCGEEGPDANAPLAIAVPGGIAIDSSGALEAMEGLPEGQGKLLLDATLGSESVTEKLAIKLSPVGVPDVDSGSGVGGEGFTLTPGEYNAALVYTQNDELGSFEGTLGGVEVRAGQASRYKMNLTVPIGLLVVRFKLQTKKRRQVDISADLKMELFAVDADPSLVKAVYDGPAATELMLPKGKYRARATYRPGKNRAEVTEWFEDIVVGATLTRTEKEIVIEPEPLGVRIDAYNYSRDINPGTSVFFFSEGADMSRAIARAKGAGGQVVEVPAQLPPGKYDVLFLYQPSPMTNPDLKIEKTMLGFEVPAEPQPIRLPVDFETPLGAIRLKVLAGEEDMSDRIEMRVMRGGADPNAATPALEEFGVSEHFIPSGTYDIYLSWKKDDGSVGNAEFIRVELGNGYIWEQQFQRDSDDWQAAPVRVPLETLRPISWVAPSAGDDDDSSGDDDDSADKDSSLKTE